MGLGLVMGGVVAMLTVIAAGFILLSIVGSRNDSNPMPAVWTLLIGWGVSGALIYSHFHPLPW